MTPLEKAEQKIAEQELEIKLLNETISSLAAVLFCTEKGSI